MPKTLDNYPKRTTSDGKNVCFRLPIELRDQAAALAEALGVTLSELMRALLLKELGQPALVGIDEGYQQGRRFAIQMAFRALSSAAEMLPTTYDEAVARFALAGPGVPEPDPNMPPMAPGYDDPSY